MYIIAQIEESLYLNAVFGIFVSLCGSRHAAKIRPV